MLLTLVLPSSEGNSRKIEQRRLSAKHSTFFLLLVIIGACLSYLRDCQTS